MLLDTFLFLDVRELVHEVGVQLGGSLEATAEVQPQHGMANRPVPMPVNSQAVEQGLVALEELLQRIDQ